ncbi:hypothetical protein EC915_102464 [Pseudomonas sp. LP_7_YM]|nr:hypothetical protein EC915_102464 [Pseudomonas sp. LP_7_YM]
MRAYRTLAVALLVGCIGPGDLAENEWSVTATTKKTLSVTRHVYSPDGETLGPIYQRLRPRTDPHCL